MRNTRRSFLACDLCRLYALHHKSTNADLPSTFVNGRSRDLIMVEMRQRIDRANAEREIEETIQVMFLSTYVVFDSF